MQTEFGEARSCDRGFIGRKWMILNQYILVNTDFDGKWFVIFEHTINCLSFSYVPFTLTKIILLFFFFFFSDYVALLNH